MDDYISRQAAIEGLKDFFSDEERTETEYGAYWHHSYVLQFLEDIPPADVRPVVRGRWVVKDIDDDAPVFLWACSLCDGEGLYESHYCPNCGADMRER